jgi:hypothetical protein
VGTLQEDPQEEEEAMTRSGMYGTPSSSARKPLKNVWPKRELESESDWKERIAQIAISMNPQSAALGKLAYSKKKAHKGAGQLASGAKARLKKTRRKRLTKKIVRVTKGVAKAR